MIPKPNFIDETTIIYSVQFILHVGRVYSYASISLLFREALPDANVADVQLAYDVSKLTKLSKKL